MTDLSVPAPASRRGRSVRTVAAPEIAMGLLLLVGAALVLVETRGTAPWFDEWSWIVHRRSGGLDTFLQPHNEHFVLVQVAIYRLLFATVGLQHSLPYRAVMVAAESACVLLVFIYARRRVGGWAAVAAAALLLFLGPGWEVILWPFEIGWLISVGAGVGCLLALDRRDRAGDIAAAVLLAIALASSGIGVVIAVGVAVEILAVRRRPRDLWIVATPFALFGLWWIGYHERGAFTGINLVHVPRWIADAAAASLAALSGLGGDSVPDDQVGTLLTWGRPLAVALLLVLLIALPRLRPLSPRVLTLAAILGSFWLLTALDRALIGAPYFSRYLYVGAVFIILITVELAAGRRLSAPVAGVLGVGVVAIVASNIRVLDYGGDYLRGVALQTRLVLGAADVADSTAQPDSVLNLPGWPFVRITVSDYRAAARDLGTPAAGQAALASGPEAYRRIIDAQLVDAEGLRLRANAARRDGAAPSVVASGGGVVTRTGSCAILRPGRVMSAANPPSLEVVLPANGARIAAPTGTVTVAVRRFADGFQDIGRVTPGQPASLRVPRDRGTRRWQLVARPSGGKVEICGLR
jgi:hypothetical protein